MIRMSPRNMFLRFLEKISTLHGLGNPVTYSKSEQVKEIFRSRFEFQ